MTKRSSSDGKAEILPPGATRTGEPALQFSDLAPDMTLGVALGERLRYWGVRRTLDTYRAVVESGLDLTQSLGSLYQAKRELEQEKERLANIGTYREGAAMEADIFLREIQARYWAAEQSDIEAQINLQKSKDRLSALETLRKIEENDRAAEEYRSEARRLEAEQQLEERRGGGGGSSYRERRRQLEQRRRDYEEMMAEKQADIEKYGGEDKLPHWLQTFYENAEEDLGMDGP